MKRIWIIVCGVAVAGLVASGVWAVSRGHEAQQQEDQINRIAADAQQAFGRVELGSTASDLRFAAEDFRSAAGRIQSMRVNPSVRGTQRQTVKDLLDYARVADEFAEKVEAEDAVIAGLSGDQEP